VPGKDWNMVKKVKKAFETIDKKTYRRYIFPRFFLTLIIGALAVLGGSSAIEYYLFNENPLLLIVLAPIIEEIGKFVLVYFLLYLARTKWYAKEGWINTGITQGFIVGLVVGIGETLAYPGTIILKFARISSIIVHADSTAIGGYGLDFKNRWLISIFY
jgi:RsiW-degrading membrane proteinase PrsW (M82 family)